MHALSLFATVAAGSVPLSLFAFAASPHSTADAPARWGDLEVAAPATHDGLSVYLLLADPAGSAGRGGARDILTLEEALAKGLARVDETSEVNRLEVENLSDLDVFIQMGDVIKGGRQDRMFTTDLLLGPRSGRVSAPVNCVEQGRWSGRGAEDPARFASSETIVPARAMRLPASKPVSAAENQSGVWGAVAGLQDRLAQAVASPVQAAESPSSLQLTLENDRLADAVGAMEKAFSTRASGEPRAVGYAYAVGSEIYGAEVYVSHDLLVKLWPKLVRAMAVEAVADGAAQGGGGKSRASKPRGSAPSAAAAAKLLQAADAAPGDVVVADAGRARVRRVDSPGFVQSETKAHGEEVVLHKMVLAKD